jgi:membrane protease YdiL (CAAX protease family)
MHPLFQNANLPTLLLSVLHSLLSGVLWLTILVAGILRWSDVRRSLRPSLILALVVLGLSLPGTIIGCVFLDLRSLLPSASEAARTYLWILIVAMSAVSLILQAAHTVLRVGLAKLATGGGKAFPLLDGQTEARRGWTLAALVGLAAAVVSVVAFHLGGVTSGFAFEIVKRMYPAFVSRPRAFVSLVSLPAFLAAAVVEEVLYRGVLQAWLVRWLGPSRTSVAGAIAVTSAFWALGHAANTTPLVPKLVQVFLLGCLFGWLARRYSIEASIAAHVTLNVTALALWLVLGW